MRWAVLLISPKPWWRLRPRTRRSAFEAFIQKQLGKIAIESERHVDVGRKRLDDRDDAERGAYGGGERDSGGEGVFGGL
jgi:hypothetical protein